jgi:hypothetical protein
MLKVVKKSGIVRNKLKTTTDRHYGNGNGQLATLRQQAAGPNGSPWNRQSQCVCNKPSTNIGNRKQAETPKPESLIFGSARENWKEEEHFLNSPIKLQTPAQKYDLTGL